ncbi:unnamed protein product [Bodo saltans]|uniref:Uncharacterized protein n=1 Tax=Bodo saltans TaxID=75058 RepID=A0A0S4JEA0_BODSA|nr:unnamed protein product [Bodo saltans]|eukprot:CUG88363.1 unnamed protein product [Bodo saltans]
MSAFEALEPKSKVHFDVLGNELVKLLQGLSSAPHFNALVTSFIGTTLTSAPSTHKAFEKALFAAIQAKDSEEKAAREKAEGKQRGLGKFRGFAKQAEDVEEEEAAGVQQVYTEEELQAMAKAEEEELQKEIEREAALEVSRKAEADRRIANEKKLQESKRVVDADEAAKKLAALGFEIVAPAWDEKKKGGKKGKR